MKLPCRSIAPIAAAAAAIALLGTVALADDVDGPDDCTRNLSDFGDAPEGFGAYFGVMAHFPTCLFASPAGTWQAVCPPLSTAPGPTGYVQHTSGPGGYWLGCELAGALPQGIDSEPDAKSSQGIPISTCANIAVDCIEPSAEGPFGQDECFGDDDAGLVAMPLLPACGQGAVTFTTDNCGPGRPVFLNVLIDMNKDGDWNDNFQCGANCAYEWVLKNVPLLVPPGCFTHRSPAFLVGPNAGPAWMRISISDNPANDDFPWAGSATLAAGVMAGGETEDYLVQITENDDPCRMGMRDFGDAPESIVAYPSMVVGAFPTCTNPGPVGTIDPDPACPGLVPPPPGPAGWVEHRKVALDPRAFWLGCSAAAPGFIDPEPDGKVNLSPVAGAPSDCDNVTPTDCVEGAVFPGFAWGQDECYGDGVDAGLVSAPLFDRCAATPITLTMYNCQPVPIDVFVNVLVDWNEDGDWNDVLRCPQRDACAPEWAIRNLVVALPPGCTVWTSPPIQVGPTVGFGWMRVTLSEQAAPPDFPWNGSVGLPGNAFEAGETEDYPVYIQPSVVGVEIPESKDGLWLARIVPNPSSSESTVRFGLSRSGSVRLMVYDVAGRRVRTLVDGTRPAGANVVAWDLRSDSGGDVAPGIYLVRLEAEGRALTSRVTRIR